MKEAALLRAARPSRYALKSMLGGEQSAKVQQRSNIKKARKSRLLC